MNRLAALAALVGLSVATRGLAQSIPGFAITKQVGGQITYTSADQSAVLVTNNLKVDATGVEPAMRQFARATSLICPGLDQAPLARSNSISELTSVGQISCRMIAGTGAQGSAVVLAIRMPNSTVDSDGVGNKLLMAMIGAPAALNKSPVSPRLPEQSNAMSAGADVFRVIPSSGRPIAMIQRPGYSYGGVVPIFKVTGFALFANGFALDGCNSFDPRNGPPTPMLTTQDSDCKVLRWRKSGANFVLIDEDGKAEDPQEPILSFRKGERLNVDYRTSSGFSSGPVTVDGSVSVNATFSNQLQLRSDGMFGTRSSSGVSVSGNNIGGGGGRDSGISVARYELDGFLIAITDTTGTRFRLVGKKFEGSDMFIHLDGRLFWKDD